MDIKCCPNTGCNYTYPRRKKPEKCPECNAYIGKGTLTIIMKLPEPHKKSRLTNLNLGLRWKGVVLGFVKKYKNSKLI